MESAESIIIIIIEHKVAGIAKETLHRAIKYVDVVAYVYTDPVGRF